jgi:hypothetical protein
MQGLIRCAAVAGALSGCGPGGVDPTSDARPTQDGTLGPSGLIVEWSSSPSMWPSTTNGIKLEKAQFYLGSLRVIGDSAPGDERTTVQDVEMVWEGSTRPSAFEFKGAPTGLYSQIAILFDRQSSGSGSDDNYIIEGEVNVNGTDFEFRVKDDRPLQFNVTIDEMVRPGEMATIPLRINFSAALESVDWDMITPDDGKLKLEDGDTQMSAFRTKLTQSFEVVNDGGSGVLGGEL